MKELRNALSFFWSYVREYKPQGVVILIAIVAFTFFNVQAPIFLGRAIEELAIVLMNYFTYGVTEFTSFYRIIWTLVVFYVCMQLSYIIQFQVMAGVSGKSTNRMQIDLFKKLESLTIRFFDTNKDGDVLVRFTSDMTNISEALNVWLIQVLSNTAMIIGLIIMMFRIDVGMSLVTLSTVPIAIVLAIVLIRKNKKYSTVQQKQMSQLNGYINEKISGAKTIITQGIEEKIIEEFIRHNEEVKEANYKSQLYHGILLPVMQGMSLINLSIVILYGINSLLQNSSGYNSVEGVAVGAATLGLIVVFIQYSQRFYMPLIDLSTQYSAMQLAIVGASRVKEVIDYDSEVDGYLILDQLNKSLCLEEVEFSYNKEKKVLHNINLNVNKGEMVALVGTTGCGKTTIMNLINRFYDVCSGSIKIDGVNVRDITLESLRNNIGLVLQDSILMTGSIRDNIAFGKPDASDEEVIEAAKLARIHDFIISLPESYDTIISEENNMLSTGQKQLLCLARVAVSNPSILILDEATSNVDTVTESRLQKAMEAILEGRTSIVIAHRLRTILNADKIVVMDNGHVIEEGNHESLLAKQGFYAELYQNQFV